MKVNLNEKLARFSEHWSPKLVAQVNDMDIKLVKIRGEFVWHHHDGEDELFLVLEGRLLMQFRDREEWIEPGEFISYSEWESEADIERYRSSDAHQEIVQHTRGLKGASAVVKLYELVK